MAKKKFTDLTALGTTPAGGDIFAMVDDPGGTPVSKKVTYTNMGVPANTTHRSSDGTDHANVVLNDTHRTNEDAVSGIVKCDGASNYSAAVANTDYAAATHASRHQSAGADAIKLDDLASPDDNTDLNASAAAHGLLFKLENTGTKYLRDDGTWQTVSAGVPSATIIPWVPLSGNGSAITTGSKFIVAYGEFAGTITGVYAYTDRTTTTTLDIWKTTHADYDAGATHPVNGDSITAAAPVAISSATKYSDTTLTGWTTSFSKGDIFWINVDANDNAEIIGGYFAVTAS